MSAKPKYIANLSPSVLIDYCGIYTMGIWFPIPHPKKKLASFSESQKRNDEVYCVFDTEKEGDSDPTVTIKMPNGKEKGQRVTNKRYTAHMNEIKKKTQLISNFVVSQLVYCIRPNTRGCDTSAMLMKISSAG